MAAPSTTRMAFHTAHGGFTGTLGWVQIDIGKEDHDHFTTPGGSGQLCSLDPCSRSVAKHSCRT